MPQALAVIGAVTSVAGTVASYSAQRKAGKAAQAQQELATRRSNRQAIREAQLRRAQAFNAAAQMGALGGSAIEGGVGSLGSQLGSGLGFSSQMSGISADIQKYSQRAATWGAVASIGGTMFQLGGGIPGIQSWMDTRNAKPNPAGKFPLTQGMRNFGGGR